MAQFVDVLGTQYEILVQTEKENPKLQDANGLCEAYSKKIVIDISGKDDKMIFDNVDQFYAKVVRHEIVHAFFHEAGLDKYMEDETLVDAIAILIPKMYKAMGQVDLIKLMGDK